VYDLTAHTWNSTFRSSCAGLGENRSASSSTPAAASARARARSRSDSADPSTSVSLRSLSSWSARNSKSGLPPRTTMRALRGSGASRRGEEPAADEGRAAAALPAAAAFSPAGAAAAAALAPAAKNSIRKSENPRTSDSLAETSTCGCFLHAAGSGPSVTLRACSWAHRAEDWAGMMMTPSRIMTSTANLPAVDLTTTSP